jgi:hypothetical protein
MMYKLWYYLFGWDYIYWENTADYAIAKIHTTYEGIVYYKYGRYIRPIVSNVTVIFLTCDKLKYIKGETNG